MAHKSDKERKRISRAKRQARGWIEVGVWVPASHVEQLKAYAARLRRAAKSG
jgi:hypothetical protein